MKKVFLKDNEDIGNQIRWPQILLRFAFIFVILLSCYSQALNGDFVWDDDNYITPDSLRSGEGLKRIWLDVKATRHLYYPLTHTTFWLEYQLYGLHSFWYHFHNVMLHAANAVLVWLVSRSLGIPHAGWVALLFALHPVHVESVAWITQRKNLLSGFFYLLSLLMFFRFYTWPQDPLASISQKEYRRRQWFYRFSLFCFLGSLLSKSAFCTLPVAILIVLWWKKGRVERKDVLYLIPFFILALGLGSLSLWMEKTHVGAMGSEFEYTFVQKILIAGRVFWFYIGKLIGPVSLSYMYPQWTIDPNLWWQYLFPLAALLLFVVLWKLRIQIGRGPLSGVAFLVVTVSPVIGFLGFFYMKYAFVADHYQYLPSLGLLAFLPAVFVWLTKSLSQKFQLCLSGAVIVTLGFLTWQQGRIYQNSLVLYQDILKKNPQSWFAYNNLGYTYFQMKRYPEAYQVFQKSILYNPRYAEAHYNLGYMYLLQQNWDQAIEAFQKAIDCNPEYIPAYLNLSKTYAQKRQFKEAIQILNQALSIVPDFYSGYYDLGMYALAEGWHRHALNAFKKYLTYDASNFLVYLNLGLLYIKFNKYSEAIQHLERALELNPQNFKVHHHLGVAYAHQKDWDKAIMAYQQAISLNPHYVQAYYNMGLALEKNGAYLEAELAYKKALGIDPHFTQALQKLQNVKNH